MGLVAYQLKPKSAFHFGREGLEQHSSSETFSSDSLFSALVSTLARVFPADVDPFLDAFGGDDEPPMRLSSVFPRVGNLPLFPKPRREIKVDASKAPTGKTLKKIQYVSPAILARLLSGQSMMDWLDSAKHGRFVQGGAVWLTRDEVPLLPESWHKMQANQLKVQYIWDIHLAPRVTVDRVTQQSNVYQMGRTIYNEDCGLWFLVNTRDDAVEALLDELLDHLGDFGIGGERSAGYGGFEASKMEVPALPDLAGDSLMLLSRYSPTRDELETGVLTAENSAYELVDVGGWTGAIGAQANKRQRLRMIEAGSIIGAGNVRGQMVDVSPTQPQPHRIYRSGIALTLSAGGKP